MTLRERKKSSVRLAMRREALRLFSEKGFVNVSVDEIAAAADVSRSTFFRYFGSKEAVLFDEVEDSGSLFLRELEGRPANEPPIVAYEEALIAAVLDSNARNTPEEQRLLEELLQRDPALSSRRLAERDLWKERTATAFARRAGRSAPADADMLAAATCQAIVEEISLQWRNQQDAEGIPLIRAAFADFRSLVSS